MKKCIFFISAIPLFFIASDKLFSQTGSGLPEFGLTAGAFSNFPANQNYLKDNISVFYLAPYIRVGRHEFSAGLDFPLGTPALNFSDSYIDPRPGAIARYKFYIFDVTGRENLFIHYTFQYLRFKGNFPNLDMGINEPDHWTETDTYINNVIGLGYNLFLDSKERFGFFYTLDYVISQTGYKLNTPGSTNNTWTAQYIWNNLSTHLGFSFRLTSIKKKAKE
jgi:hypothetical protein